MNEIYLDVAATTRPKQEVIEAMLPYLTGDRWFNPSSLYAPAVKVKQGVECARETIAEFVGADANEIIFTSSGSEANCMAIRGFVDFVKDDGYRPIVITSCVEHKSILSCVNALGNRGIYVDKLAVDDDGRINIDELKELLDYYCLFEYNKVLVSIMFANNEIGTIQPIKEISEVAHQYGAAFHTDAVQAAGQIPINVDTLGIDMMTVSGHKIGCPRGVAFLYKRNNIDLCPLIYGSQERGLRGGTENTAGIIGMAKAVELAKENTKNFLVIELMRDYLIDKLESIGCKLNGHRISRIPNNINVQTGINAESLLLMLDMSGIYVSSGSACNSKSIEPSYVLKAIGLNDEQANSSIRITISKDTTFEEIDKVVDEIERSVKLVKGETITWNGYE